MGGSEEVPLPKISLFLSVLEGVSIRLSRPSLVRLSSVSRRLSSSPVRVKCGNLPAEKLAQCSTPKLQYDPAGDGEEKRCPQVQ